MSNSIKRWIALLALLNCIIGPLYFSTVLGAYQNMFPLPFLYFIEIILLGVAGLWLVDQPTHNHWIWALDGVLLAFVVLGVFSIGLLLVPAFLLLSMLALWQTTTNKRWRTALLLPAFALTQTALMLLLIRIP